MKKLLLGSVTLAALVAGPAMAADMPIKAPPAPVACCDWTGFYVGVHGGYGWNNNDFSKLIVPVGVFPIVSTQFFIQGIKSKGWVLGGHAGYNWQKGWLVGGLEMDVSGTDINGISDPVIVAGDPTNTATRADDVKWLGTARARIGFAPQWDCCSPVWIYGTGGVAWERFERANTLVLVYSGGFNQRFVTTIPNDRFGWVAGVGAEAILFGSGWLLRLEYLHYEFGTSETPTVITGSFSQQTEHASNQKIDVVRTGLSYKF